MFILFLFVTLLSFFIRNNSKKVSRNLMVSELKKIFILSKIFVKI